jgi:hypothetical protein
MSVVAALLGAENLTVEPGRSTTCELSLSNTGTIVEQFTILALGEGAEWIRSDPPVVSMFPGAQQTVTLTFSPPRQHTTPAGQVHFGVKIIPSTEPEETVTEEGIINVGSFNDVGAELVPRVASGRVRGRQRLAVDSRGNIPIPVEVTAVDPSDALQFRFSPQKLVAAPGAAHFVRVQIRPRKRFWKGRPQLKPYQVQVKAEGEKPLVLDGGLTQKALVPKWLIAALTIAAALVLLWYFVVKPVVHDTAVAADKSAIAAQQKQTNALKTAVSEASNQAAAAQATANAAAKKAGATTTTSTTTKKSVATTTTTAKSTTSTTAAPVTSPTDGQMEAVAAPGSTVTVTDSNRMPVASGTTIQVTSIIIQNISGSSGTARIERVVPGQPTVDLLIENLSNLSSQEFTFPTPMIFTHAEAMQLRVDCSGNAGACDVAVFYSGPITQPATSTTTTIP